MKERPDYSVTRKGKEDNSHAAPAAPHQPLCTRLRIHRIRAHARPHNALHSPSYVSKLQVLLHTPMPILAVALALFFWMTCCVLGLKQDLLTVQDTEVKELEPMMVVIMAMVTMLV